jgi:hypothetical protein
MTQAAYSRPRKELTTGTLWGCRMEKERQGCGTSVARSGASGRQSLTDTAGLWLHPDLARESGNPPTTEVRREPMNGHSHNLLGCSRKYCASHGNGRAWYRAVSPRGSVTTSATSGWCVSHRSMDLLALSGLAKYAPTTELPRGQTSPRHQPRLNQTPAQYPWSTTPPSHRSPRAGREYWRIQTKRSGRGIGAW